MSYVADRGSADLDVNRETEFVANSMGAQTFEPRARVLGVVGKCLRTRNACHALQAEHVVNAARPDQGIVGEVAFPNASMVRAEGSNRCGHHYVCRRGVKHVPQFKMPRLLR